MLGKWEKKRECEIIYQCQPYEMRLPLVEVRGNAASEGHREENEEEEEEQEEMLTCAR